MAKIGCDHFNPSNGQCSLRQEHRILLETDWARRRAWNQGEPPVDPSGTYLYPMSDADRHEVEDSLRTTGKASMQEIDVRKGGYVRMCTARTTRNPERRADRQEECSAVKDGRAKIRR